MSSTGEDIRNYRIGKLGALRALGIDPYPENIPFDKKDIITLQKNFVRLARSRKTYGVVGRILAKREHGKSVFIDIFDGTGKIQLFIAEDRLTKDSYAVFVRDIDIGDFIAAQGKPFYTKHKEPTIEVSKWQLLSKSLRPLPEKWHGLMDIEERFRKRYLDILMNEEVRMRFQMRSRVVQRLRSILEKEGFQEVETPMLHPIFGGALARPFITHHNSLDADFYLRVAPELYLKRLIVAGLPRVYELGRNFRNEGIDHSHNPEFTMLELYVAYWTRQDIMAFVIDSMHSLVKSIFKSSYVKYRGERIDFSKHKTLTFANAIERYASLTHYHKCTRDDLKIVAERFGVGVDKYDTKSKIADSIFKKIIRPKLIQPTFLTDHPLELSPLAKKDSHHTETTLRFQFIAGGLELVNGFSELNDPLEQADRFRAQETLKEKGEMEVMSFDADYLEALEYGMPPTAGLGIGIDRLIMLFTDTENIKEVILFPTLRPRV